MKVRKILSKWKIGAAVTIFFLLVSMVSLPITGSFTRPNAVNRNYGLNDEIDPYATLEYGESFSPYDAWHYVPESQGLTLSGDHCDIGYNCDAGNNIRVPHALYIGEPIDETVPGRGRTAKMDPSTGDTEDWYRFAVCEGQSLDISVTGGVTYEFYNANGEAAGQSLTADTTGFYYLQISKDSGSEIEYSMDLSINGQNDAGSGSDAGNTASSAKKITPGSYFGYMDYNDREDWYSFDAADGEGIFITIEPVDLSDFDLHLYNPAGEKVHSAMFYGEDDLEYPADASGTWKVQIDMFPGWDEEEWPDNYFLYGSGPYSLELSLGGAAEAPPGPIPQPDITPIAKTFIVNDDPTSNMDEYGYIAAVAAANYLEGGQRYLSPIVYQGVDTLTNWFGTVDDTTQYLIDDWDTYLARHGLEAEEYIVPADPIEAAADIALDNWESAGTAVVVCDGSGFADEITTVFDEDVSLSSSPEITRLRPGDFTNFGGDSAKIMYISSQYGAIQMLAHGENYGGDTALLTPRYESVKTDDWPFPYDEPGPDLDTWYPITIPGIWIPSVTSESNLDSLEIIKYKGDRYTIPMDDSDASIEVTIETDEPSFLMVYLIDPLGNVRKPMVPKWNGGEVQPLHYWNGGHWPNSDYDDYRRTIMEPRTETTVSVHNAMEGDWTAIVVPYIDHYGDGYANFNGNYHITANLRTYADNRVNAALSAANGAVIASMNHAPLLYVSEDSIPTETADALSSLGVGNVLFVNIGDVSSATPPGSVTEYTSLTEVVDVIKQHSSSENFITITSMATGEGYFAPSAMAAAYHTAPVLNIGEAKQAYNYLDMITAWREHVSDAYHGCRTMGHVPKMNHPADLPMPPTWLDILIYFLTHNQELPHPGLDLELKWMSGIHDDIKAMIDSYNLDGQGKEAYLFVAPRDTDIRDLATRAMMGNNSFAGHIMLETPAMSSALIVRDVLYPAVIFANPGRDETSSCFMNFRNGNNWLCNDGNQYPDYVTQYMKEAGFSHGRKYIGHTIWENLLEQYNGGCSIMYHCSHGTGGSGICCMYENVEEQFPLAELTHEHLRNFNWWDGWRGYLYDSGRTPTPRLEGLVWFNAREPNLYDIVHFKWCDQLFENLHSQFNCWMSCTTQANFGPDIYLEHGAALSYGNANTGLSPQSEVMDQQMIIPMMMYGKSIGDAHSDTIWLHERDYTTMDPTTIYGSSSMQVDNEGLIFGDPTMTLYSPEWIEPTPITP